MYELPQPPTAGSAVSSVESGSAKRRGRLFRRLASLLLAGTFVVGIGELASRGLWWSRRGAPFWDAAKTIYGFYPQLRICDNVRISQEDDFLDVLILGGSVVFPSCGSVPWVLREQLALRFGKKVRIFNLSFPAHNSMDSYYKYSYLDEQRFDLVLVYHGINEVRANNCPDDVFRDDYSHNAWYDVARLVHDYGKQRTLQLPFTANVAWQKVQTLVGLKRYIPFERQPAAWLELGRSVKTAGPFRENLTRIVDIARSRGETVLLCSFAYCVEDPSAEAFDNKCLHFSWGKPEFVAAAIDVHNAIALEVARSNDHVVFVDQSANTPADAIHFSDMCHLTKKGCARFVANVVSALDATSQTTFTSWLSEEPFVPPAEQIQPMDEASRNTPAHSISG